MGKGEIRAEMKARERSFADVPGAVEKASRNIVCAIESRSEFISAKTILCYMDIAGEVKMKDAVRRWSLAGKTIAIPLVCGDTLVLKRYDPDALRVGYMGIPKPREDAADIAPEEIALAIVPGVAFTQEGTRLGRGKGFYDRLLPQLHCPKIGVCFGFRLVEELPADKWDIQMDAVISSP